jgi:trigger factor
VEKRFGDQIAQEVKQALLDEAMEQALKRNELAPIADPELDLETVVVRPAEPVDLDFTVTVKPEFDLPELGEIEVEAPPAEPSAAEVEQTLLALRKRKATLRPLEDGEVAEGDVVTLHVRGSAGEQEVLREENLAYEVGSKLLGDLITEGLDEALVGKRAGATAEGRAFAPPYAENHPLQGVELVVAAELVEVKRPQLPEVDEALAKAYDFETRDELLEAVKRNVRRHKEEERERFIEDSALGKLVEKCAFELPEDLIRKEADELARRAAYELQMRGETEEAVAKKVAELRARRADETTREMKAFFVLDKLVEKERILVPETEVREAVAQIAAYNEKTPDQMYAVLRDAGRLSSLRNQLRVKKARARLRKKVKVKEGAAPREEPVKGKAKRKGE